MKKVRMGLMALAAICSISAAFAFSPKANKTLNTYYAVSTGSTSWTWVSTPPDHKKCSDFSTNQVSCSAEASSLPADNTMPAGQPIDHQAYQ